MRAAFVFAIHILMKHAGLKVLGEKAYPELVKRRASRDNLLEDVQTRSIRLHHFLKTVDLARNSCQSLFRIVFKFGLHLAMIIPFLGPRWIYCP